VAAAETLVDTDASSTVTLAYDAARFAALALLAQQGLRATTKGGHLAVDDAVRAQTRSPAAERSSTPRRNCCRTSGCSDPA